MYKNINNNENNNSNYNYNDNNNNSLHGYYWCRQAYLGCHGDEAEDRCLDLWISLPSVISLNIVKQTKRRNILAALCSPPPIHLSHHENTIRHMHMFQ